MAFQYSEISTITANYLSAAGAVAISEINGVVIAAQWLERKFAKRVKSTAADLLARNVESRADIALCAAADIHRVKLTPDRVARDRAATALALLDECERAGLLRTFNAEYRRRRQLGSTRMNYFTAKKRFFRLLVQRLAAGGASHGLIDDVFSRGEANDAGNNFALDFALSPWQSGGAGELHRAADERSELA